MASVVKNGAIKRLVTRSFAAQAATASASSHKNYSLPQHKPEVSTLGNGIVVASLENNAPISNVALIFKSGARYETDDNLGVSNVLRICAGLGTKESSAFALTRITQQMGGNLYCENGREHILYGMNMMRDNFNDGYHLLTQMATQPCFKHWEVNDEKARLLYDWSIRDPITITIEMLHEAAFRNSGLGHSLYLSKHRFGKITPDKLHEFVNNTHKSNRMAVVGLGVDHSELVRLTKKLSIESGEGIAGPSAYASGEVREDTDSPLAYVAVVGPGTRLGSEDAASFIVAQSILGISPGTKYGSNATSKLATAISSAGGSGYASCININYSDSGLFGFFVVEEKNKAGDAVKAAAKAIKGLKVSETDVKQAKARAKATVMMANECSENVLENLALQAVFMHSYKSASEFLAAIDKVTASSVENAIATMLKGKPSMSAYGGISRVPYLDQL